MVVLDTDHMSLLERKGAQGSATLRARLATRLEILARGFEDKLAELYEPFQRSECSFGYMAEQVGITTWALYALLERRGLRTTNL